MKTDWNDIDMLIIFFSVQPLVSWKSRNKFNVENGWLLIAWQTETNANNDYDNFEASASVQK